MLAVSKHHSVYMRTLRVLTCGVFFCFPPLSKSGRAKKRLPGTFPGSLFLCSGYFLLTSFLFQLHGIQPDLSGLHLSL